MPLLSQGDVDLAISRFIAREQRMGPIVCGKRALRDYAVWVDQQIDAKQYPLHASAPHPVDKPALGESQFERLAGDVVQRRLELGY